MRPRPSPEAHERDARSRARAAALVIALWTLGAAPTAHAAGNAAQVLFDDGEQAYNAGQFGAACAKFEQSYRLEPLPGVLFAWAECDYARHRYLAARARFADYVAAFSTISADKQQRHATRVAKAIERQRAIEGKLGTLTVTLPPGAPAGTRLTCDHEPVATPGAAFSLDPGDHVIEAVTPDGRTETVKLSLAEGEKRAVVVTIAGAPEAPSIMAPSAPPPPPSPGPNALLISGAAVAGGAVVAGAVMLGVGASKTGTIHDLQGHYARNGGCASQSDPKCADLLSALSTRSTLVTAGMWTLVGGAAVGAGTLIYGLVSASRPPSTAAWPMITPGGGGLTVRGSF